MNYIVVREIRTKLYYELYCGKISRNEAVV